MDLFWGWVLERLDREGKGDMVGKFWGSVVVMQMGMGKGEGKGSCGVDELGDEEGWVMGMGTEVVLVV